MDTKVSALTSAASAASTDLLLLITDPGGTPASKKITVAALFTSPTIVTPTIASFVNATHDHTNAAGGGTLNASAIAAGQLAAARGGFGADVSGSSGVPLFAAGVPTFTSTSGTGNFARVTSPTFVTPTLGAAGATSVALTGTGGAGYFEGVNQASAPGTPTSAGRLFWDSTNRLSWIGTNGFTRAFDGTSNTASRVYVLPDADSKFPIFSQVVTFSGPTAARTYTLPDANATLARTDASNTFAAAQTINGQLTIAASQVLAWQGKSNIFGGTTDGVIVLWNSAQTDFTRLQFGGSTSSFPALKRSSANLEVKLADDSAYSRLAASGVNLQGVTIANLPGTPAAGMTAYVTNGDASLAWGATAINSGGGATKYLVWYNGANWTVLGK